ncbi:MULTISPECIES: transporter substrate-binding domain-containing protein [Pseudomonas]|uniref:transporter substrate-binding domain-containing protein n=1 Tax=Pseudomonas TaxID=286 RepID=UPI0006424FB6|nr:transporter substrate-binding domain-containing protein [Pseudomonas lundensis]MBM1188970.1 transporter substrate-binding domain-containing protein [Pseudomonas lundensis]NLU00833.1 transporter substrate-binding domain-containing protein [Pseudomonas lundensis]NNA01781.1 transporter substrate-binding domain-containing protein [Pseudomonas lundensis]NNA09108.1 transporter substrate-binding domain-containing protein [Pseudomonas lundensis]NNA31655.1 transporter substrate-binding domain-contai
MQNYKKFLLAAAATLVFSANALAVDKYKVGIEGAYPPFNNKNPSGQVVGFDYDIAMALCAKMKAECEVVTSDWDGIIPALNAKKYDFIVSSLSITEDRKQAVDFTDPYYSNKQQFVAKKGVEFKTDIDSLKSKQLGTQRSTQAATWLEDNVGGDIKLYDTQENAYLDLSSGRVDGLLADKYAIYGWLKDDPAGKDYEFKGKPINEDDKVGIALRKGESDLRTKLNLALKEIKEDGTYKKINDKYFPFSIE